MSSKKSPIVCSISGLSVAPCAMLSVGFIAPASGGLGEQLAADQHAPDLAGAGADLVQLGVAPQPLDREVLGVADAAQRLDRLAGHPGRLLGRIEDGTGRVLAEGARMVAAVAGLADRVHVGPRGLPG